ncbi:MAG: serpin family protein [Actinomycetes bacterium]
MRRNSLFVTAVTLTIAIALTSACGGPPTGIEVEAHTPRAAINRSTVDPTVIANSSLGSSLYRAIAARSSNFVFSPYGISVTLAMAAAGARGSTADQLNVVQHLTPGLNLDEGLNAIGQELENRSGPQSNDQRRGEIALDLPTSLWIQKQTRVKQPFLDTLSTMFGTGIRTVDFRSDPEASRNAMNNWIRQNTHRDIEGLVPRGLITDVSRLVLTSAASLNAPWDIPFESLKSRPAKFTLIDGQSVNPVTMTVQAPAGLLYAKSDGWEAVSLPYLGRQLEMVVIAPDPGRFADVEARFDGAEMQRVITLMRPIPIELHFPKFGFTSQQNLADMLIELGAPAAFTPGDADFSAITDDEPLAIASFPQQTYLSADEDGTAQSTASQVIRASAKITVPLTTVHIDRPFIVMVIDRASGEPLVLGRVMNPTA